MRPVVTFARMIGVPRIAALCGIVAGLLATPALQAQAPTASFLTPVSASAGDPAVTLTVVGNGFVSGSVVYWSNQSVATTFVNMNQLSATIPSQLLAAAGQFSVYIAN